MPVAAHDQQRRGIGVAVGCRAHRPRRGVDRDEEAGRRCGVDPVRREVRTERAGLREVQPAQQGRRRGRDDRGIRPDACRAACGARPADRRAPPRPACPRGARRPRRRTRAPSPRRAGRGRARAARAARPRRRTGTAPASARRARPGGPPRTPPSNSRSTRSRPSSDRGVAVGRLLRVGHAVVLRELRDPAQPVEVRVGVGANHARRMGAPDALQHRALQHARLAGVRAGRERRDPLGLEHHHAGPAALQHDRRRESRDAGTHHGHVEAIAGHHGALVARGRRRLGLVGGGEVGPQATSCAQSTPEWACTAMG